MNRPGEVEKIKTEVSEGSREEKGQDHHNSTLNFKSNQDLKSQYQCNICTRQKIVCPCNQHTEKKYETFTFKKRIVDNRQKKFANQSMYESYRSVPKITFTYASHQRNHSFSIPKVTPIPNQYFRPNQLLVKHTTTTTLIPHQEEILYYPVIHNVFKAVPSTPLKVDGNSRKQQTSSRKRIKRSFVNQSIQVMKDASTNESKDPMTPQQFKKFSDWLLEN